MDLTLIFEDNQEEDIDQMISDAKTCKDNQGMELKDDGVPPKMQNLLNTTPSGGKELLSEEERKLLLEDDIYEQDRQDYILERKRESVRDLFTSLNRLSAGLFAAISVVEQQIAILQDLYTLFLARDQTKTKAREGGYSLRQNTSFKDIAPTLTLSENPEQLWPGDLVAIDRVVRERKSFIKKIKVLVENMGARRETV